jgi:AraC-like DNA-binding protein
MRKIIISIVVVLLATFFYAYGKIDYDGIMNRWSRASLAELKADGNACLERGAIDSALVLYTMVTSRYDPDMDRDEQKLCAQAFNNAAYVYMFHLNNYSEAYVNLLKAQHIAEDIGFDDFLPCIYLNIGNVYTIYYDNDTAIKYYKKAFYSGIEAKDWEILLTTFTNLIGTAVQEGYINDVKNEVYTFKRTRIPQMPMLAYSRSMGAAAEAILEGRGNEAVAYARKAVTQVDTNMKPERFRLFTEMLVAVIYENMQRYDEALAAALDVERKAMKETADIKEQARFLISELYAKTGEADSSLYWRKRQMQLRDSLFRNQQYNRIRDLNVTYEMQNADAKLQRSESKRRTVMVALAITTVATVVILALALAVIRRNRRLDRRNHDLYRRNSEIMRMNEAERKMRAEYGRRIAECEREIERLSVKDAPQAERRPQADGMDDAAKQSLLEKISVVMDDVGEISKNEFSVDRLSKLVGSNSHYVSQVINETYGKNFSSVLGEARVRQACKRLGDTAAYGNLTIEAIAGELGFKPRSNFVTVFKKVTGLTPSEYKKISKENISRQADK